MPSATILDELLDRRLDQPNPAVVAVQFDVAHQFLDGAKATAILLREDDLHVFPFVQHDLGPEIPHDHRERLPVVSVRWIPHQSRPAHRHVDAAVPSRPLAIEKFAHELAQRRDRTARRSSQTRQTSGSNCQSCQCRNAVRRR